MLVIWVFGDVWYIYNWVFDYLVLGVELVVGGWIGGWIIVLSFLVDVIVMFDVVLVSVFVVVVDGDLVIVWVFNVL